MLLIPLQPKPNQTLGIMLNGQPCEINIFQKSTGLFVSLYVDNKPIVTTRLVRHGVGIVRQSYLGFDGDLVILDMKGQNDPYYTSLGDRYQLFYIPSNKKVIAEEKIDKLSSPNPTPTDPTPATSYPAFDKVTIAHIKGTSCFKFFVQPTTVIGKVWYQVAVYSENPQTTNTENHTWNRSVDIIHGVGITDSFFNFPNADQYLNACPYISFTVYGAFNDVNYIGSKPFEPANFFYDKDTQRFVGLEVKEIVKESASTNGVNGWAPEIIYL